MLKSVNEIKQEFINTPIESISKKFKEYEIDNRIGVQNIINLYKRKYLKYQKELSRLEKMKIYEENAYKEGKKYIAGLDEVGRGPLAGPVVTASVILPKDFNVLGINDSKKLSAKKREELFIYIKEKALEITINMEDNKVIDEINILQATIKSMLKNIQSFEKTPDYLIIDAIKLPTFIPYFSIPKADEYSISVASASIIAKVTRDSFMDKMHEKYPQYNFIKNKGYGTSEHIEALKKYGACPIHRKSFIKNIL